MWPRLVRSPLSLKKLVGSGARADAVLPAGHLRLLGEPEPALVTRTVISAWEGLLFGSGLVLGLTRRPR